MSIHLLLAGLFASGVLLVFAALARAQNVPSPSDRVVGQYGQPVTLEEIELQLPFAKRVVMPALRGLARALSRYTPQQIMEVTRHKLDLAGNPLDLPPVEFLGLRILATALMALLLVLVFTLMRAGTATILLFAGVGAFLGFYLPLLWLNLKIRQRREEIQLALADALDLLTICVEAGSGLDAAIAQVVNQWNNQLSRAFGRALVEIRLGKSRQDALRDMAERAGVADLTNFVAAIVQAERYGAGIANVLRIQSEQMRVIRRQRAQARANEMPVKLVFPLVFFFFPSIFIILLGPAVLRLMKGLI
jgi:tight adherence protein C